MEKIKQWCDRQLHRWLPRYYARQGVRKVESFYQRKLSDASLSQSERYTLKDALRFELGEFIGLYVHLDDLELLRIAEKRFIYLKDYPTKNPLDPSDPTFFDEYWVYDSWGNRLLHDDTRDAISKAIRDNAKVYRQERREDWKLFIQSAIGIGGVIIGILSVL